MTTDEARDTVGALRADPANCPRCWGCGQIADSDDAEPWICWETLPSPSNLAVLIGLVKPLPCPDCGGSAKRPEDHGVGR